MNLVSRVLLNFKDKFGKHFRISKNNLVIDQPTTVVSIPIKEISSHKHISFAQVVIRLFSGRRYDFSLLCFRSKEIKELMILLRQIESENRKHERPPKSLISQSIRE